MVHFLLDILENMMGKGENAGFKHFPFFLQCSQRATFQWVLKFGIVQ